MSTTLNTLLSLHRSEYVRGILSDALTTPELSPLKLKLEFNLLLISGNFTGTFYVRSYALKPHELENIVRSILRDNGVADMVDEIESMDMVDEIETTRMCDVSRVYYRVYSSRVYLHFR